jgi:integrase
MNGERWIYTLYFILLSTGLRIREATALAWDDINSESNLIRIGSSYDRFEKKIKTRTKGGKTRFVPLNESLKVELLSLRNKTIGSQVFPHPRINGQVIDADYFREFIFYRDVIESGMPKIKVHDLRHTFASNFLMSGGSLFDLQQILGHSSYEMTKRYAHLSKAHLAKQRSIIDFKISDLRNNQGVVAIHPRISTRGSETEILGVCYPPQKSERGQDVFHRESSYESVPSQILPKKAEHEIREVRL